MLREMTNFTPDSDIVLDAPPSGGMGFALDPISSVVNAGANIFTAIKGTKDQQDQLKLQKQQLQAQQDANAQALALEQLRLQNAPAEQQRQQTLYGLYAVGGIAALVGIYFISAAVRKKKK